MTFHSPWDQPVYKKAKKKAKKSPARKKAKKKVARKKAKKAPARRISEKTKAKASDWRTRPPSGKQARYIAYLQNTINRLNNEIWVYGFLTEENILDAVETAAEASQHIENLKAELAEVEKKTGKKAKRRKNPLDFWLWIEWKADSSKANADRVHAFLEKLSKRNGFSWSGDGCGMGWCDMSFETPSKNAAEVAAQEFRALKIPGTRTHVQILEP